ncbi:MAG: alpha/beta hydrolase [Jatrophihabitans sp.]
MPKPPSRVVPSAASSDATLATGPFAVWPGSYVEVGGAKVHVRSTPPTHGEAAEREPALFVHGLGGSSRNWTDFAGLLRDRVAIEAIDLLGHGRSGPAPDADYSPRAQADAVVAYLEKSDRGPVHLVGNSMGGAISILVASTRPDLVRTLTLISPAVPDNRPRLYPLRHNPRMALLVVPALGEFAVRKFNQRFAPEVRAKGTIALCFAKPDRYSALRLREDVAEMSYRESLPWANSALLRSMRALATSQLLRGRRGWATMRRVAAPTLVVWGDTDRLVAPDLAPYVAAAIPDSRLRVLTDIGHTAMMEDPSSTAALFLGLLDEAADVSRSEAS